MFSNVWSENTALFERLMEIHLNSPKLYYGFNHLTAIGLIHVFPPCANTCLGEIDIHVYIDCIFVFYLYFLFFHYNFCFLEVIKEWGYEYDYMNIILLTQPGLY